MAHAKITYLVAVLAVSVCPVYVKGTGGPRIRAASYNRQLLDPYGYPILVNGPHNGRTPTFRIPYPRRGVHYTDFWTTDYGETPMPYYAQVVQPPRFPSPLYASSYNEPTYQYTTQPTSQSTSPGATSSPSPLSKCGSRVLTGKAAFGDWRSDAPGVCRKVTAADMPAPFDTPSTPNFANPIPRPAGAWPKVLPGFKVDEFFTGMNNCRIVRVAPNGDIFVAEMRSNRIRVLRAADGASKAETASMYADGLNLPFGIAFHPPGPNPQWVYVGCTDKVVRFAYQNGDLVARGTPEVIVPVLPSGGNHVTRDVTFSPDGTKMYVSVGSASNYAETSDNETDRAQINVYNPDGSGFRAFAAGIRNGVGLAINPTTGKLWVSTNERDGLGDNLVPDYITSVNDGEFFGWPWYYIDGSQDPRKNDSHPELRAKMRVPDVLLQPHSAPLQMTFYTGQTFPAVYRSDAFACSHGSWNRGNRTGYKVIRVPMVYGVATGEYEDFMTGFVTDSGDVWGRPVGVAVARDGALLVSDDVGIGSDTIWRISYTGNDAATPTTTSETPYVG